MDEKINDNGEIDVGDLFRFIAAKFWAVVLGAFLGCIIAFVIVVLTTQAKYESTTGIYVMSRQNGTNISYSDTQTASQLAKDCEEIIKSRTVLESVMEECGIDDSYEAFAKRISVTNKADTRILYITVTDSDAKRAMKTANAVRIKASEHIKDVMDVESINVVDEANLPEGSSSRSAFNGIIIGTVSGMVVAFIVICIVFIMDDKIRNIDDVDKYLGLYVLAMIPDKNDKKKYSKSNPTSKSKVIFVSTEENAKRLEELIAQKGG